MCSSGFCSAGGGLREFLPRTTQCRELRLPGQQIRVVFCIALLHGSDSTLKLFSVRRLLYRFLRLSQSSQDCSKLLYHALHLPVVRNHRLTARGK